MKALYLNDLIPCPDCLDIAVEQFCENDVERDAFVRGVGWAIAEVMSKLSGIAAEGYKACEEGVATPPKH